MPEQMLHVLSAEPLLKNTATDPSGFAAKTQLPPSHEIRKSWFEIRPWCVGLGV
jgi:hypothetical protein